MTATNRLMGLVAITSVLLAVVVPAADVYAATPANQSHQTESSRSALGNRTSVCPLVSIVDHLTVSRNRPLNHETFTFPAIVRSTNTSNIRSLARALCALPVMPKGVQACPVDLGVHYTLQFAASGQLGVSINPVVVSASGCGVVTGLPKTRWVIGRMAFWKVLGVSIGLPHAAEATFAGKLPSGN
jgi:hypothetical protein